MEKEKEKILYVAESNPESRIQYHVYGRMPSETRGKFWKHQITTLGLFKRRRRKHVFLCCHYKKKTNCNASVTVDVESDMVIKLNCEHNHDNDLEKTPIKIVSELMKWSEFVNFIF